MNSYTVRMQRWSGGWELSIEGVGHTTTHDGASLPMDKEALVRDCISLLTGENPNSFNVTIIEVT